MKFKGFLLLCAVGFFPVAVRAADAPKAPVAAAASSDAAALPSSTAGAGPTTPPANEADLAKRTELATKMHQLRPTRDQVWAAIDQMASQEPEGQREGFRQAMRSILNYQAIEKISIDAMVDTYTAGELQAMVDYYSKPEAQSAAIKDQQYGAKVYPEIMRMLDQAMMRIRTGGNSAATAPADKPAPTPPDAGKP